MQSSAVEDHWAVRQEAAELAAFICAKYGDAYHQMQPRIIQALSTAFADTSKPLVTHYGMCLTIISVLTPYVAAQVLQDACVRLQCTLSVTCVCCACNPISRGVLS